MKLFKPLMSRIIIVVLLIGSGCLGITLFTKLANYSEELNLIFAIISVLVLLYIINKEDNPAYKLAWAIPILIFPLFGGLLYLVFGDKRPAKSMRRQMDKASMKFTPYLEQKEEMMQKVKKEDPAAYGQMRYINDCAHFPVYEHTESFYYKSGEECFPVLLEELKKAEHFIFMEYFIIEETGVMWNSILDILKEKAAAGVDVRLLYDDAGCVTLLPYKYYKKMEQYGIQCEAFNHVVPFLSLVMNNRDHRKITVIDGHTGFMGGWNLADEYINEKERFGYWKDTGVMLRGDAVWNLTTMFLTTWNSIRGNKDEDITRYMPARYLKVPLVSEGYVQPYGDSPLDREPVSESVYLNMIHAAQDYIYITTPYLVIDNDMAMALLLAAKRGVDVRIITPGIPDKKNVFLLTQSYYPRLVTGGVKVYQFDRGFVHAKSFVCDDKFAIVGTINLDFRSLYLHFECGTFFYKTTVVAEVKKDFMELLEQSTRQEMSMLHARLPKRLAQAVLRVFSPLM